VLWFFREARQEEKAMATTVEELLRPADGFFVRINDNGWESLKNRFFVKGDNGGREFLFVRTNHNTVIQIGEIRFFNSERISAENKP